MCFSFTHQHRIINFLKFKNIPQTPEFLEKFSGESKKVLRDIEEFSPFPIGFIGPIESVFQWATMILTAYSEISQETVDLACKQIEEKIVHRR